MTDVLTPQTGDTVIIAMYDGRKLRSKVLNVFQSVGAVKVKAQSGDLLLTVNLNQVVKILPKEKP